MNEMEAEDQRVGFRVISLITVWSLLLLWGAENAGAASPSAIQVESTTQAISIDSRTATFVVSIEAGGAGAQFGLALEPGPWLQSSTTLVGSPAVLQNVGITGGGSIRPATQDVLPLPVLIRSDMCRRERPSPVGPFYWVELPANSRAQVVAETSLSFPAWPGTVYRMQFSTFASDSVAAPRIPFATVDVPISGALGRQISTRFKSHHSRYFLTHGMMPSLLGSTSPPFRFGQIMLRVVRPTREGSVSLTSWKDDVVAKLGAAKTDRGGKFEIPAGRSLPPGRYAVVARSGEGPGMVSADWNCGPFFNVRGVRH